MNNGWDRPLRMKGVILSVTPCMSEMNLCRGLSSTGGGVDAEVAFLLSALTSLAILLVMARMS